MVNPDLIWTELISKVHLVLPVPLVLLEETLALRAVLAIPVVLDRCYSWKFGVPDNPGNHGGPGNSGIHGQDSAPGDSGIHDSLVHPATLVLLANLMILADMALATTSSS